MADSLKSLAEVKVDSIHCSPLVDPICHVTIKGYKIRQARFTLGESMLTTPDDVLFFYMLGDDLQNDLFRHLSTDGGEADWLIVSQVLLLSLFE